MSYLKARSHCYAGKQAVSRTTARKSCGGCVRTFHLRSPARLKTHASPSPQHGRTKVPKRGGGRGRLGAAAAKSGLACGTGEFYKWIITAEEGLNSRRHCLVRREETARRTADNGQVRLPQVGLDNSSCKVLGELHWPQPIDKWQSLKRRKRKGLKSWRLKRKFGWRRKQNSKLKDLARKTKLKTNTKNHVIWS